MHFSAFLGYYENSVPCAEIREIQFEDPATDRKLSTRTLIEEFKPIAMVKYKFESELSFLEFWTIRVPMKVPISISFPLNFTPQV